MRTLSIIFAALSLLPACWGQGLPDQMNFVNSNFEGFQIYGVSAFFGYSSYDFPGRPVLSSNTISSRMNYGTSGTVGWQRLHGRSNFSARYTGGYRGDVRNSAFNKFNHSLTLGFTRPLGRKWTVSLSAVGQQIDLSQYIFEPSTLGSLAQSQAGFSDVAAAFSVGQFSSSQSGLLLGGQNTVASTQQILLGNRILTYRGQVSLSYQVTTRLSIRLSGFSLAGQRRYAGLSTNPANNYVMPRTFGGDAGFTLSYSLSPRTDFSVGVTEIYVDSRLQRALGTSATASLGRKMGRHWFLTGYGGGTYTRNIQSASGVQPTRQLIYGGSLGFETKANTLLASYSRTGFDQGNAIIGTSIMMSGAWAWRLPLQTWSLNASFDRNETRSGGLSGLTGWRAGGGVSKTLGWNLSLTVNYVYMQSKGVYLGIVNQVNVDGFRVAIGWAPQRRRAPATLVDAPEDDK